MIAILATESRHSIPCLLPTPICQGGDSQDSSKSSQAMQCFMDIFLILGQLCLTCSLSNIGNYHSLLCCMNLCALQRKKYVLNANRFDTVYPSDSRTLAICLVRLFSSDKRLLLLAVTAYCLTSYSSFYTFGLFEQVICQVDSVVHIPLFFYYLISR